MLKKIFFNLLYKTDDIKAQNFATLNIFYQILWTILYPSRLFQRIKYNRFIFPTKLPKNEIDLVVYKKNNKEDLINEAVKKLKKYGAVILDSYFEEEYLLNFEKKYKKHLQDLEGDESIRSQTNVLTFSDELLKLWLDETLIKIISIYIKRIPLARGYPDVVKKDIKENLEKIDDTKIRLADDWHIDHSSLIQSAIYFNDVKSNSSRMQVLPGSHTKLNLGEMGYLSNEYITNKKLQVSQCTGRRGSVQIHCGNVYHRFFPVKNTSRKWIKFEFSSGTNILLNPKNIAIMLADNFDLNDLDLPKRKILSGIFPIAPLKGFAITKKGFKNEKYKGL